MEKFDCKSARRITPRENALTQYLCEVRKYEVLTSEEQMELIRVYHSNRTSPEGIAAKEKVIKSNLRFALSVAKASAKEDNIMDLIQEANIGLSDAVECYEFGKGCNFISYAIFHIRKRINRYIIDNENKVRRTNQAKTFFSLSKIRSSFAQEYGREPTNEELLNAFNEKMASNGQIGVKNVEDVITLSFNSIDTDRDDDSDADSFVLKAFEMGTASVNAHIREEENEYNEWLVGKYIMFLKDKERDMVVKRFGLFGGREYSEAEIGKLYGIEAESVNGKIRRALKKIREKVSENSVNCI